MVFDISREYFIEPRHVISNNVVCATCKGSDQTVHTHRLTRAFASRLNISWLSSYWVTSFGVCMQRLVWVYTCKKYHIVGNLMSRLILHTAYWSNHDKLTETTAQVWRQFVCIKLEKGISHGIIELLGQFKCGNLNVHIWAWFGYFIYSRREIGFIW